MNYGATNTTFKKPVEYLNSVFHNVLRSSYIRKSNKKILGTIGFMHVYVIFNSEIKKFRTSEVEQRHNCPFQTVLSKMQITKEH